MTISNLHASTIVDVRLNFGFAEFTCTPQDITNHLKIQPDSAEEKGALKQLRSGRETGAPISSWTITSKTNSKDINDHFKELLLVLVPVSERFLPQWGVPSFGVLWKSNNLYTGNGPYYEAQVLEQVAVLGCDIFHDIYQIDLD